MKELNIATTQEELDKLKSYRESTLAFSLSNPNENRVFDALPNKISGKDVSWERQYIFGYRILDFYCPERKVAIEVGGKEHNREYDAYRDEYLFRVYGVPTLRVRNNNKEDLDKVVKILDSLGKATFGNRNLLFKDCLGPNSSIVDREELAKQIPYDDEHCLLGRFLLSKGFKSDYQVFRKKGGKHWKTLAVKYNVVGSNRRSDIKHLMKSLTDLGHTYFKLSNSYVLDATPQQELDYRKYRIVTNDMIVLRSDTTFRYKGVEGEGLDNFFNLFGGKEFHTPVIRAHSPYVEYGSVVVENDERKIKLKDYIEARCKQYTISISVTESLLFGIKTEKGWLKRHSDKEVLVRDLIPVIEKVIRKKDIIPKYKSNLSEFLEKLKHSA